MPPVTKGQKIQGSERVLANGATLARFRAKKADGTATEVSRIIASNPGAAAVARTGVRSAPKPITLEQAKKAFDRFYSREDHKGYASLKGQQLAKAYDSNHTTGQTIADARYLKNPSRWEFQGVDTGAKIRKALTAKQVANLAAGRAAGAAKKATKGTAAPKCVKGCVPARQVAGYWW